MSQIRAFAAGDLDAVAGLFQRTFGDGRAAAPASLRDHLTAVFLDHPWQDPDVASRVHVGASGDVNGFIGVMPLRLQFDGRPVRAGVAGSLMVDAPEKDPMAGARLLRAFLGGPQDLSISETSNPVSLQMWDRMRGHTVAPLSTDFVRVFRPGRLASVVAEGRTRVAVLARPAGWLVDGVARRVAKGFLRLPETRTGTSGREVDDETLIPELLALAEEHRLHPQWDPAVLHWFLGHAALKEKRGTLHRRLVSNRSGATIGAVLYYSEPKGLAWVLQMLAQPGAAERVVDDLLTHLDASGMAAVRGRTQPGFLEPLLRRGAILYRRAAVTAQARDPNLLTAIGGDNAIVTGLAGESWSRLVGGAFA